MTCDGVLCLQRGGKLRITFRYLGHVETAGRKAYAHGN